MKKLLGCLFCFTLSILTTSAQGDKTDAAKIQGTWIAIAGIDHGKKLTADELTKANLRVVLKDGKYKVIVNRDKDKDKEAENGTYKLDPAKKPATIDFVIGKGSNDEGKTQLGIYKFDGDNLTIAIADLGAKDRPKTFDGGKDVEVTTLKRTP